MGEQRSASEQSAALSALRIDRAQRPTAGGRGWALLAATIIVVAAIAAGAAWWYYRTTGIVIAAALSEKPVDVSITRVPADSSGARESVVMVANGKIVSDRVVNVATKVSGQIVELLVEQGDHVEKNQVLARIEDVIYRAQRDEATSRSEQMEHAAERARAETSRAEAAVAQARAENEMRQRDFHRLKDLFEKGQASEFEFLNAKNVAEAAQAAVQVASAAAESAAKAVEVARTDIEASRAVLRLWQKRLDDCDIRAPIGGIVLDRNAEVGDFLAAEGGRGANANAQLVSIADMSLLRVEVDVSERDISKIFAEQRARVTPDADRKTYDGRVMWVDPVGDYARAIVQVKVRIAEPGPGLRVSGSAKVEFLARSEGAASSRSSELWLPKCVVQLSSSGDDALVFTVSNGRAVAHAVQVGTRGDKSVGIRSGVQSGMELICENVGNLKNGTPVRVLRTAPFDEL